MIRKLKTKREVNIFFLRKKKGKNQIKPKKINEEGE
jgi:hypothetical protein